MEIKLTQVLSFKRKNILNIIMRTFIFLFCTTVFSFSSVNVSSQNTKIEIDSDKTITIDEVFSIIKKQTDYNFIYKSDMFKDFPKINLKKGIIKVSQLLEKSLSNGNFDLKFPNNNTILIKKAELPFQSIEISGNVTDENGIPLPGITVFVTNRKPLGERIETDFITRGTATDIDGNFTLKAEVGYYLVAYGLGYQFSTKTVTSQTEYNIVLKERAAELDEVVLVGYGSKTREQISSAISSVKNETINQNLGANVSFDNALPGLIKGVQINQNTGRPGSTVDINIRGITSPFNGGDNQPLFVIDGVPFQANLSTSAQDETAFATFANPLLSMNPNDIESIDVLKDAAATSIYGSRGANGVIIVKTKTGKRNQKMSVTLSANTTFGKPINTTDWLNAQEFKDFSDAYISSSVGAANAGQISPFGLAFLTIADIDFDFFTQQLTYNSLNDAYFGDADVDWNDIVYRNTATTQKYDVSINGGTQNSSYYISLGHISQEGLLRNDKLKQYNLRLGIETRLNKTFRAGASINTSFSDNFSGYDNFNQNLGNILNTRPDVNPKDDNGNYIYPVSSFLGFDALSPNPLAVTTESSVDTKSYSGIGSVFVEAKPLEGLTLKLQTNGSINIADNKTFVSSTTGSTFPRLSFLPEPTPATSTGSTSKTVISSLITDLTAAYSTSFGENHNLDFLAGYSWQKDVSDRNYFFLSGFPDDDILITATNALSIPTKAASVTETGLNSMFGRASYNYKNKYFFTGTIRQDKSSRFGPNNQDAVFPSVSASWNIAKESFMENLEAIDILRLRGSFGEVGSVNIADFRYIQFFERGFRDDASYNGQSSIGLIPDLVNEDIKWERTQEHNIGLDYSLFKGRLKGNIDIYNRETTDALISSPFPLETGAIEFTSNFATVSNKGFEIEISGDIIRTEDFTWSAGLNISKNTNKLEEFNDAALGFSSDRFVKGREIGIIKGHIIEGVFQTADEVANSPFQEAGTGAGDYKYKDISGPDGTPDGIIDDEDRDIIGSTQPDFFGGFNSSFRYKGFQLSALFSFSKGTESTISDPLFYSINPDFGVNTDQRLSENNRWSPTNTDATLSRLVSGDPNRNSRTSSANVFDSSYLRLNNVQLSYSFSGNVLQKIGLNNLTLTASGSNLWTMTDFPGLDPAVRTLSSPSGTRNSSPYPNSKSWSLSINVKF